MGYLYTFTLGLLTISPVVFFVTFVTFFIATISKPIFKIFSFLFSTAHAFATEYNNVYTKDNEDEDDNNNNNTDNNNNKINDNEELKHLKKE